jgi:hypothetical protein
LLALVEALRVNAVNVPHQQRKIGLPRLQNKVVVVAHETPGQRTTIKALQSRAQHVEQGQSVHVVFEDRLATVAP